MLTAAARLAAVLLAQESPSPVSQLAAAARTRQGVARRALRRMGHRDWLVATLEPGGDGRRDRHLFEVTEAGRVGLLGVAAGLEDW